MIHQTDPLTLVAVLGALEVQIATRLLHEPLPVTQTHLCNVLHKTDKTVAKALYNLGINKICTHSPEGWRITPEGEFRLFGIRQQPQASSRVVEPESLVDTCPVDKPVDTCPVDAFPQEKGRKNSNPGVPSITGTNNTSSIKLINKKLEKNLLLVLGAEPEPELDACAELEPEVMPRRKTKSPERIRECLQSALEAGILEPKASSLAELLHVTPELIEHHVERALGEGQKIGLAIFRIERNWEIRKPKGRRSRGSEDHRRFVTGKYAD